MQWCTYSILLAKITQVLTHVLSLQIDEASANLRVQLESMPEEIDKMKRQLYRLQVEEAALSKEKDKVSNP